MTTAADLLARVPFLAALSSADRENLAAAGQRRRFGKGQTIFHKDDPGQSLFIIEEGAVRIYLPTAQGADLTVAVLGAGDFFGDVALLDGRPRSASAAALEATATFTVDRADFIRLLESRPSAAMAVLAAVTRRLRETDEMAADLAFLDVAGRLAKKLLELAQSHGAPLERGVRLTLPLTQEDLASMVGVTRESANRHLSAFRRRGLIDSRGRYFVILDQAGLRRYID
ncbi:MAG TPA: Crp/Fnr family transcriptional regulator [Dehalococcoidia bacterium]|nr:Crp/Fnr family transcriptional regulator [Dehalococcoidia bacterium]